MSVAVITGSAGLVGSESTRFFADKGFEIVGIDNDMRRVFFGESASTAWSRKRLERDIPGYTHFEDDVRDSDALGKIFRRYQRDIALVIHAAAQPSHDWSARDPQTDFTINANGTLNLLQLTREICPDAAFVFTSTNKVYGDTPNRLPLEEQRTRWELPDSHAYGRHGIDESMDIDHSLHSLFGASKLAADALVQEFGRYYGLKTAAFRGGCLTGPWHSGAQLHGFLAYLMTCAVSGDPYTVFGYKAKQVRDNIHAHDLARAFWLFFQNPHEGEVYNIGGSRHSNCSVLEAIEMAEQLTGRPMRWSYEEANRIGDHIWWISDVRKFQNHYPDWSYQYDFPAIMKELHEVLTERHS